MAPLPANSTARYFVDYTTGTEEHTFSVRANPTYSPADLGTDLNTFLTDISPLLNRITIIRVRYQPEGSNVSAPVATAIDGNDYGGASYGTGDDRSKFLNFVGRSSDGRRVRLAVYGVNDIQPDYRVSTADSSAIIAAVDTLNTPANAFLTVSGLKPLWYPYANTTDSAYWQKQLRA